jgi:membrane protein
VEGPRWRIAWLGVRRPHRVVARLVQRVIEARTFTMAAAVSFFVFLAAVPFVLFLLALVSLLPLQGLEDWLLSAMSDLAPGQAYHVFEVAIRGLLARPHRGVLSVGVVLAVWYMMAAFVNVMDSLNQAYRVREGRAWWQVSLVALALTLGLSFLMILAFVLAVFGGALIAALGDVLGTWQAIGILVARWVVVAVLATVLVAIIYHFCPDVEQRRLRWVTPGSVLFTVGFGFASAGFSFYVRHFGWYNHAYGSLGAVIILLIWIYILSFFLLLGGQVNAILEDVAPQIAADELAEERSRAAR